MYNFCINANAFAFVIHFAIVFAQDYKQNKNKINK